MSSVFAAYRVALGIISVVISWLAVIYLIGIHFERFLEMRSIGSFGFTISILIFLFSLPMYVYSLGFIRSYVWHILYWVPLTIGLGCYFIFGVSFAP